MNKRTPLCTAALLLAALSACGGDDSGDSGLALQSTPAPTPAAAATAAPSVTEVATSAAPAAQATEAPSADSGDDTGSGERDLSDPCSLISLDQLRAAFDSPFDAGELTHFEQTGGNTCTWSNSDAPPVKVFGLTVYTELADGFGGDDYSIEQLFHDTREVTTVDEELDLGDEAYAAGASVSVLADGVSFEFSATGTSDEAVAGVRSLAEDVLAAVGS